MATKLALWRYPGAEITIARCIVPNEDGDNERFARDAAVLFGRPIVNLSSMEYHDCWEVWENRKFISGPKGAPCTVEMKKVPRWTFEKEWQPDFQVFGYTAEEARRADRFRQANPEVRLLTPLIEFGVSKDRCKQVLLDRGLRLPRMYDLGFSNANCKACGKASSIIYWARTRHYFPAEFSRMAVLSRKLGARLTRLRGKRIYLDEVPDSVDWRKKDRERVECGIACAASRAV